VLSIQVKATPIQHIRHESIDEVENLPISNKRKASPNRETPSSSNPIEHGSEVKRPKQTNYV